MHLIDFNFSHGFFLWLSSLDSAFFWDFLSKLYSFLVPILELFLRTISANQFWYIYCYDISKNSLLIDVLARDLQVWISSVLLYFILHKNVCHARSTKLDDHITEIYYSRYIYRFALSASYGTIHKLRRQKSRFFDDVVKWKSSEIVIFLTVCLSLLTT